MTVRTNAVQTCDRCLKPFNEKHLKAGDEVPTFKQTGLVITKVTGTNKDPEPKSAPVLSFDDMCPDCQSAVDNLIAKIRLDGSKPKVAKKRRSRKKDKPAPPPVETYSEKKPEAKGSEEPAEKPGPDGEPATTSGEPQESQEAAPETTEEPPAEGQEESSESKSEETSEPEGAEGGNGAEAGSDDDNLMTDPATGDVYDKTTGEVVSKGNSGESEKHPF